MSNTIYRIYYPQVIMMSRTRKVINPNKPSKRGGPKKSYNQKSNSRLNQHRQTNPKAHSEVWNQELNYAIQEIEDSKILETIRLTQLGTIVPFDEVQKLVETIPKHKVGEYLTNPDKFSAQLQAITNVAMAAGFTNEEIQHTIKVAEGDIDITREIIIDTYTLSHDGFTIKPTEWTSENYRKYCRTNYFTRGEMSKQLGHDYDKHSGSHHLSQALPRTISGEYGPLAAYFARVALALGDKVLESVEQIPDEDLKNVCRTKVKKMLELNRSLKSAKKAAEILGSESLIGSVSTKTLDALDSYAKYEPVGYFLKLLDLPESERNSLIGFVGDPDTYTEKIHGIFKRIDGTNPVLYTIVRSVPEKVLKSKWASPGSMKNDTEFVEYVNSIVSLPNNFECSQEDAILASIKLLGMAGYDHKKAQELTANIITGPKENEFYLYGQIKPQKLKAMYTVKSHLQKQLGRELGESAYVFALDRTYLNQSAENLASAHPTLTSEVVANEVTKQFVEHLRKHGKEVLQKGYRGQDGNMQNSIEIYNKPKCIPEIITD
jgi:hypothetical protein